MNGRETAVIFVITGFFWNYASGQTSALRKLTTKERIEYSRNQKFPSTAVVYKDSIGNTIRGFNPRNPVIHGELYSGSDFYVGPSGKIVEIVVRKATTDDQDLNQKLFDIEEEQVRGSLELKKIDCLDRQQLLLEVLKKDRNNRSGGPLPPDVRIERENEAVIIEVLEQCGPPTREMVGDTAIKAIYFAILHGSRVSQQKYMPVILAYVKSKSLRKQDPAMLEDKLLKARGEKQKYGTQINFFPKTGFELYPIADPSHVDERRKEAGLPPLEEYLKKLEEAYETEIKR